MEKITFKVQSFRHLPNPYQEVAEDAPKMYLSLCDVTELPDNFPMETNPREQNLNTSVAKRIKESLKEEAEKDFFLLNRGILLSAKEVKFENAKSELTILFEDSDVHGNVDGGHTYAIIKELKNKTTPGTQFVKLEILTGVEDIFTKLSAARNISVQVTQQTIAEQEKRFQMIKTALQKDSSGIDKRISFRQNEEGDIDITEILAILNLFNLSEYPNKQNENHPTQSYSGKAKCTERYIHTHKKYDESIENPYVKMTPIMADIFKLYNRIETKIGDYYVESNQGGRYGRVKGVTGSDGTGKFSSKFYGQKMDYATPTGFIYPILGAFRSLVREGKNGYYEWTDIAPFATMDELGKELVSITVNRNRTLGYNPHAVGKDREHWRTLYITVKMYLMEHQQGTN